MRLNQSRFARNRRREIAFSAVCFVLLLALVSVLPGWAAKNAADANNAVLTAANWGLSFPEPGQTPVGNVEQKILQQFNAYYVGDCSQPVIYLTFDAGFENGCTEQILDALQKHNVPAAFFLVGSYIREYPELVQRMVAEGHIVGNHTNTHPDMAAISDPTAFQAELAAVEQAYQDLLGQPMPKFYRPPQGKYSEDNLQQAQQLGYNTIFWSLAYVDWYENDQPSREEAFDKLLSRIHPGAIVLLHSTSATNAEILDDLLTEWENMGYVFKPLTELPGVKD